MVVREGMPAEHILFTFVSYANQIQTVDIWDALLTTSKGLKYKQLTY